MAVLNLVRHPAVQMLLSVDETARALRVSRATVFELISTADLPTIRVGRRRLVPMEALRLWIADRMEPNARRHAEED